MDLLSSLLGSMTSSTAVDSISQKSGGSSDQVSSLVSAALPLLLGSMTNNASTEKGASSLLNALSQHTSTAPVEEQIKEADEEDGGKIINHILGKNTTSVTKTLSKDTGLSTAQVTKILAILAPVLLTALSGATKSAKKSSSKKSSPAIDLSDGIDAKDILGAASLLMSANNASSKSSKQTASSSSVASSLVSSLLSGGSNSQASGTANLLGALLGGGSSKDTSSVDGTALISSLLTLAAGK
ncbi:MAG: DUF937 domain-containing protein [Oscillospiraceae bacterium]|nr:DUF937 domain-containing protein [Oscillospiraceae bacterium]